jgi:hypothetical protein
MYSGINYKYRYNRSIRKSEGCIRTIQNGISCRSEEVDVGE